MSGTAKKAEKETAPPSALPTTGAPIEPPLTGSPEEKQPSFEECLRMSPEELVAKVERLKESVRDLQDQLVADQRENRQLKIKLQNSADRIQQLERENQNFFQQLEAERQSWQVEQQGLLNQISQFQAEPLVIQEKTAPVETVPAEEEVSTGLVLGAAVIIVMVAIIAMLWFLVR